MLLIGSKKLRQKRALDYGTLQHLCSCPFSLFLSSSLWSCYSLEDLSLCHSQKSLTQFLSCSIGISLTNWLSSTEYEPHGKKMHVFIGDYLIYFWDFKINKKAIYHEDRIEPVEEIVFEKTNL